MRTLRNTLKTLTIALPVFLVSVSVASAQIAEMLSNGIQQVLWDVVVNFFGTITAICGALLDYSIQEFIVGFGSNFLASGVGQAVDTLWVYVRDLFNLFFIFGLVWLGLQMILNSDDSGTRRWLVNLIMAALLVNFSLYITKFIVDITNVFATQIVNNGFGVSTPSQVMMNSLALSSAFGSNLPTTVTDGGGGWAYIFGTAMVLIVAAFVFAAGAVMLMLRYAVLAIYMVLSPLMFIGWVFPQLSNVASRYWRGFLGRAFYAPVYILLLYFAAFIMERFFNGSLGAGQQNFSVLFSGNASNFQSTLQATMPAFIIACIFMISAIVVGQKLGADGAGASVKMGRNLTGRLRRGATRAAGAGTAGVAAWGARNTAGRAANAYANSETGKRRAATSYLGKQAYRASKAVAGSSFDARQVGGVGKDLGVGTGTKGGYAKTVKDREKADEAFAKDIKANVDLKDPKVRAEIEQKAVAEKERLVAVAEAADKKDKEMKKFSGLTDEQLAEQTKANQDLIESAEKEIAKAETSDERRAELTSSIENLTSEISTMDTLNGLSSEEKKIEVRAAEIAANDAMEIATNDSKLDSTAVNIATAKTKYANEIAYIEQLERSAQFWQRPIGIAGGAGTGTVAGAGAGATATGGAGGLLFTGGTTAGLAMADAARRAEIDRINRSVANLKRTYGEDGTVAMKKDNQTKEAKLIAEQLKEMNSSSGDSGGDSAS